MSGAWRCLARNQVHSLPLSDSGGERWSCSNMCFPLYLCLGCFGLCTRRQCHRVPERGHLGEKAGIDEDLEEEAKDAAHGKGCANGCHKLVTVGLPDTTVA